ncbi:hypothetical protein WG936_06870 [Corynebacterium sp. H127]|uniref:hypothetical protein n=1 Tax=Corynebacterium sp. H127 TaxID=3133418 RepID=UPI0030AD5C5E
MNESFRYDLTAPLSSLTFPVIETLLLTTVCWMAIGWADNQGLVDLHNGIAVLWMLLIFWRLILPLLRLRRQRFAVTSERLIVRAPGFGSREDSIPLQHILGAYKKKGSLYVDVSGMSRPLIFPDVPKAKRVAAEINELIAGRRQSW